MTRYLPLFIFFMLILGACTSSSTLDAIPPLESLVATPTTASSQTPVPATPTSEVTATPLVEATFTPMPTQDPASLRTHYDLQLLLDYNAHLLNVQETITYTNRTTVDLSDLMLVVEPNRWPGAFTLTSIIGPDGELLPYALQAHRLMIALAQPLAPGDHYYLTLDYMINIPEIPVEADRPVPFGYTARQINLVDWYAHVPPYRDDWLVHDPGFFGEHQVYEMANFTVDLQLQSPPEGLVVAASGTAQPSGNGYRYQLQDGRSFAISASNQYQLVEISVTLSNGRAVKILHYGFPFVEAMSPQVAQATGQAVQLYSELFGDYPYDTLSVVQADFMDGMEYQSLFFLSRGFYNSFSGQPDDYLIAIAVHETAHQWWFGLVGNDQAMEPWLDEALCTYSEALFYERYYPDSLAMWRARRIDFYEPSGWIGGPIYAYGSFREYRDAVYLNGALFLEGVRQRVGDEAFFAFLKDYAAQRAEQIATGEDFFTILSEHSSADISDLITQYFGP